MVNTVIIPVIISTTTMLRGSEKCSSTITNEYYNVTSNSTYTTTEEINNCKEMSLETKLGLGLGLGLGIPIFLLLCYMFAYLYHKREMNKNLGRGGIRRHPITVEPPPPSERQTIEV